MEDPRPEKEDIVKVKDIKKTRQKKNKIKLKLKV